jgi:hydroxymethylbilane synthase
MTVTSRRPLRLATRRSALALAQSRMVGQQLAALTGRPLELVEVTTQGDVDSAPLSRIGGTGVFVAAVREAVAGGAADVAVHSLKDLPTAVDPRLRLAAVPVREDPRDALISAAGGGVADLPRGATVGTGSPRRRAQLLALRPDLRVVDLRGNVDTRLARVGGAPSGPDAPSPPDRLDAVLLAAAGLARLGRGDRISAVLEPDQMLPAPGQGALAVEVRADLDVADPDGAPALLAGLDEMDHGPTRAAVTAERSLLAALEAGCSAPVGALAEVGPGDSGTPTLTLRAVIAGADGSLHRGQHRGRLEAAEQIGASLAERLLAAASSVTPAGIAASTTTTSTAQSRPTVQGSHPR